MQTVSDRDQIDINYNNIIQCCLEVLDETGRLSSNFGNLRSKSNSKNMEMLRQFLLLGLDIQKKTAWEYIPVSYKKIMAEQSGLLSKNLVQSIRNLDFAYSYLATQYQQSFGMWADCASILTQSMAGIWGFHVKYMSSSSSFLYEQDKQFVETIRDIEKDYENFEYVQTHDKKSKPKSIQNYSKTMDDTSTSSVIQ